MQAINYLRFGEYKRESNHDLGLPSPSTMSSSTNNSAEDVSAHISFVECNSTYLSLVAIPILRQFRIRPEDTQKNTNGMPVLQR